MKRLSTLIMSSVLGSLVLASNAFAGVNYAEYRAQFDAQKARQSTVAEQDSHACCPMCNGKSQCDMQGCGSK